MRTSDVAYFLRDSATGRGLSFATLSNEETLSVKINVLPESPLPSATGQYISNIENKRADLGQTTVDQDLLHAFVACGSS